MEHVDVRELLAEGFEGALQSQVQVGAAHQHLEGLSADTQVPEVGLSWILGLEARKG